MSYAYLSHIVLKRDTDSPLYAQLRDALRELIRTGILPSGTSLPSSRYLCEYLNVHRQTVVTAIDDLIAEGWVVSVTRKGVFVNSILPEIAPIKYTDVKQINNQKAHFTFNTSKKYIERTNQYLFGFDDGYADIRIAPYKELGKAYTETLNEKARKNTIRKRDYGAGNLLLRQELEKMMRSYRGMSINVENVLLTHGSQMSIYLVASSLINRGDYVIVTKPNYQTADKCFQSLGAQLLYVSVDENGMNTKEVEELCKKKKIRFLFITSHHHHPTTVSLSIDRRIELLQLSEKYGFAILEDDYDYDYHFKNKPIMPIASNDRIGSVIYIGSFSKILSQSFRVGYVIAPKDFIEQITMYRKLVDRQGDEILEEAVGKLLQKNIVKNHIRKAVKLYKQRRDDTYKLFNDELGNYMMCKLPEGGLAFWAQFDKNISLPNIAQRCSKSGLFFPGNDNYNYDKSITNACRMGFASMNTKELHKAIDILKAAITEK